LNFQFPNILTETEQPVYQATTRSEYSGNY
jgi:hypothetical protein